MDKWEWDGDVVMMPWMNRQMLLEGRTKDGKSHQISMTKQQVEFVEKLVLQQHEDMQQLLRSILEESVEDK